MRRHVAVLGLDQHVAVLIDQDGAKGVVAMGERTAGNLERPAQKMFIEFAWAKAFDAAH